MLRPGRLEGRALRLGRIGGRKMKKNVNFYSPFKQIPPYFDFLEARRAPNFHIFDTFRGGGVIRSHTRELITLARTIHKMIWNTGFLKRRSLGFLKSQKKGLKRMRVVKIIKLFSSFRNNHQKLKNNNLFHPLTRHS